MSAPLKFRPLLLTAILFVIAFDVAFLWQRLGGAYVSEFGGHPDEAAHFVTGLMVRDYVTAGFPGAPMEYAKEYYDHYPKIGLGVWPPVFYAVQAMWTLPFGVSRISVLLLIAACAALTALLIFQALRSQVGGWQAALGALLWMSLPLVRDYYGMVMAEMLSAFLMFGAALVFGRFLKQERTCDAVIFGVLSGLAIMTKGTGLALALMVPLALLFSAKWHLLARPALWAGAAITAILAGPWTWKFKDLGKGGWLHPNLSSGFTMEALPYYMGKLGMALGPVLLIFFILGIYTVVRLRPVRNHSLWAVAGALLLSVLLFQSVLPVGMEARHLIPALPAALLFVVAGFNAALHWLAPREASAGLPLKARVAAGVAVLLMLASFLPVQRKGFSGFAALAEEVMQSAQPGEPVLVSSDARGEGMFIAEMALRDPQRPSYTVQRGSKVLANSEWSGRGYQPKYRSDQAMTEALKNGKVHMVVVDDSVPEEKRVDHHDTLKRAVDLNASVFWLLAESEIQRGGEVQTSPILLFRIDRRTREN